jgi:hypothetical protein
MVRQLALHTPVVSLGSKARRRVEHAGEMEAQLGVASAGLFDAALDESRV